jgi:hypothetical protein
MTLKEIIEKMDGFTEDERVQYLPKVFSLLSPVSRVELLDFQRDWDASRGFEAFVKAQNEKIKMCIELECAEFGSTVREALKLEPITMESEVVA